MLVVTVQCKIARVGAILAHLDNVGSCYVKCLYPARANVFTITKYIRKKLRKRGFIIEDTSGYSKLGSTEFRWLVLAVRPFGIEDLVHGRV